MADKQIPLQFNVQIYGNLEPYSPTISKSRLRIFYRGLNRNRSYITDEFAEKLIASLPYTPVKGIYDETEDDFTDHGTGAKGISKAYGVVPERNNGAWERHIDYDGIERTYYCTDVLLWTSLYENAKKIPGKFQSMELYEPSIKGNWKLLDDGCEAYEFSDGCFLGLQVLGKVRGELVEPCFEGSAFYSLNQEMSEQFSDIIDVIKNYNLKKEDNQMNEAEKNVATENALENEAVTESQTEAESVTETAEVPANSTVEAKATETTEVENVEAVNEEITETPEVPVDSTIETEKNDTVEPEIDYKAKYEEAVTKISELENKFSELLTEKNVLQDNFNHLEAERDSLKEFKENTEKAEKEEIINKYSAILSEEILKDYENKLSNFTAIELDKELCFEAHKNDAFETQTANFCYKGEQEQELTRLERYLTNYKMEE